MKFTIYCHTCLPTGKKYVGQTRHSMEKRWLAHVINARRGEIDRCRYFYAAIQKYGPDAFAHEVLDEVDGQEAANAAEVKWIQDLGCREPSGFNIAAGGRSGPVHETTRQKQSAAAFRRHAAITPEQRRENARPMLAALTPESRAATARATNAARSPEQRARFAELARSSLTTEERSENTRRWYAEATPEQRSAHVAAIRATKLAAGPTARQLASMRANGRKQALAWNASLTPERAKARAAAALATKAAKGLLIPEEKLTRLRELLASGVRQSAAAEALGLSRSYVCRVASGTIRSTGGAA